MHRGIAVAVAALTTTVLIRASGGESASAQDEMTIRLGVRFQDDQLDLGAPGPSVGDQILVHDTLLDRRGRTVGRDSGVCTVTLLEPPTLSCVITFALPGGQIAVQFLNTPPPRKRAAVVGGTGRYRGVRGELTLVERPDQTGTATFRLTC